MALVEDAQGCSSKLPTLWRGERSVPGWLPAHFVVAGVVIAQPVRISDDVEGTRPVKLAVAERGGDRGVAQDFPQEPTDL